MALKLSLEAKFYGGNNESHREKIASDFQTQWISGVSFVNVHNTRYFDSTNILN